MVLFDMEDDVNELVGIMGFRHWAPFKISFLLWDGKEIIPIKPDKDVLEMFRVNAKLVYIHVYVASMKKGFASGTSGKHFKMITSGSGNCVNELPITNNLSPIVVNSSIVTVNPSSSAMNVFVNISVVPTAINESVNPTSVVVDNVVLASDNVVIM